MAKAKKAQDESVLKKAKETASKKLKSLNLNALAKLVAAREGGKQNLSIAQVKEAMRRLMGELATLPEAEVLKAVRRYA